MYFFLLQIESGNIPYLKWISECVPEASENLDTDINKTDLSETKK